MASNRDKALAGRRAVASALGVAPPCPDSMIGTLASLPLQDAPVPPKAPLYIDPLQDALLFEHRIEVPVVPWPAPPRRLLRISAQLYNAPEQYERLARVLPSLLAAGL
jgi:isopenicillin-N epimerase